jgi:hypothetical protein
MHPPKDYRTMYLNRKARADHRYSGNSDISAHTPKYTNKDHFETFNYMDFNKTLDFL